MHRCLLASARLTWHPQCLARHVWPVIVQRSCVSHITTSARPNKAERRQDLLTRLDVYLHERDRGSSSAVEPATAIGALLVEGYEPERRPVDVLYELAVVNGRWNDAVWIAKQILQSTKTLASLDKTSTQLISQQSTLPTLHELTDNTLEVSGYIQDLVPIPPNDAASIDDIVLSEAFGIDSSHHKVLECIWRSIGMMIIACIRDHSISGGLVKQEILEILALFHHNGLMPESVYTHLPDNRSDVVQQPATLYLLSSRIMTALTDAAWQAHEREMLAERFTLSGYSNHAGAAVRANIEGIKPEMWLELILWASLQGGWVRAGADVLKAICDEITPRWRPLSWRTTLSEQLSIDRKESVDWDELSTLFSRTRGDSHELATVQVSLTVSSELVNAYVEACLNEATTSASDDKLAPDRAVRYLRAFRAFLQRSDLNLHAGNWEATILRLVDRPSVSVGDIALMSRLVEIAPRMGEELSSASEQAKPSHVLDATAAQLGLLHQALQKQIAAKDLPGALTVFELIWQCVDDARARSIEDFFDARILDRDEHAVDISGPFTSNVRIEYPSFDPAIPLQTFAAFIDFVISKGAVRVFDSSISNHHEYNLLPPKLQWGDPAVAPSLIRLAAARNDHDMVRKVNEMRDEALALSPDALAGIMSNISATLLESFATMDWKQATSVLAYVETQDHISLDPLCISMLGSTFMKLKHKRDGANAIQAWQLFEGMTTRLLPVKMANSRTRYNSPEANILKLMSLFDRDICRLSLDLATESMHRSVYVPHARCVNQLLEAVAETRNYSSVKLLLDKLSFDGKDSGRAVVVKDALGQHLTIREPLQPDLTSRLILLRSCLKARLSTGYGIVRRDEGAILGAARAVMRAMLEMLVVDADQDSERAFSILKQELQLQPDSETLESFLHNQCSSLSEQVSSQIRGRLTLPG